MCESFVQLDQISNGPRYLLSLVNFMKKEQTLSAISQDFFLSDTLLFNIVFNVFCLVIKEGEC